MNKMLSLIIPSRSEMFLKNTVEDALKNIEADTEIIAVLDGEWANLPVSQDDKVNIIYVPKAIGQRAATNLGVRLSKAKYIMKLDAHCSFDKGFDRKMIEFMEKVGDNVVSVPIMRNLWGFDWKCAKCGKKWYQGPTPTSCKEENFRGTGKPCDSKKFVRKIMWVGKEKPQSTSYCFDATPHFQYFLEYRRRPEYKDMVKEHKYNETMSLQGSCFMCTREKYWEWEVCDEKAGSWGNQGLEVACAAWLSGGRVLVNQDTWYAHMFRTQGGDFSFPYEQRGRAVQKTKQYIKDKFWNIKHPMQKHPVSWLVKRFWPVNGWTEDDLKKLEQEEQKIMK